MSARRFLSLGSNIEPDRNIPACLETLKKKFPVKKISAVYETEPVVPAGGGKFWNAVVEIESGLAEDKLVMELRAIEALLGRRRDPANKFAPRSIDIDVLPQAGYQDQGFIMVPLSEIAPEGKDMETGKTFLQLAEKFREEKRKYRKVL